MLTAIRDAVILYNPIAGRGRLRSRAAGRELEAARDILKAAGIDAELQATTGKGSATALARQAVAQCRQLVVACGGDGTVNEVVNGLAGSRVPMALLPAGTANVLAKELRIPWDVRRAAELLPRGTLRRIALGLAVPAEGASRYFIAVAGAGPDAAMIRGVHLPAKLRLGILAYWLEGFRMFFTYDFPTFQVTTAERSLEAAMLVVGRTKQYAGPVQLTAEADLFEDAFEVMAATPRKRYRYFAQFPRVLLGQARKIEGNLFWKTRAVRCQALGSEPVYAQVDGEPVGALPVEFRIVPDALTLVVPETRG